MQDDKGLTSDQYIHSIALKNKNLTDQVRSLVKSASVGCRVHATSDKELQTCVKLPQNLPDDTLFRTMLFHEDLDDRMYGRQVARLVVIQRQGQKYFLDRESGNLYNYDKLHSKNELFLVGKL